MKQPVEESDSDSSEAEVEEVRIINEIEEEAGGQEIQTEKTKAVQKETPSSSADA